MVLKSYLHWIFLKTWQLFHCVCVVRVNTICFFILLGFSLQPLAKELLLLGQILFDEAVLAHLLPYLHNNRHGGKLQRSYRHNTAKKKKQWWHVVKSCLWVSSYLWVGLQPTVERGRPLQIFQHQGLKETIQGLLFTIWWVLIWVTYNQTFQEQRGL